MSMGVVSLMKYGWMNPDQPRFKRFVTDVLHHVRRPTRRGILAVLAAGPILLLLYTLVLIPFTPGISDIRKAKLEQPARVLSADGQELAEFKRSNREWVSLQDISPHVVAALIATEDHRFYDHFGLDWRRIGSAVILTFSGDRQGGSTITQQLARNLYPDEIGRAASLTRKLKEAITALKIEALYTKEEILETYLNTVPFLYNAFGIEMAARTYFDKSARRLDVLESATLIGMLKGNSSYNPVLNPERSLQRRNIVLSQMVKREKLAPEKFELLKKRPLRIDFERQTEPLGPAPHFAQYLRKWLINWADENDYNIHADGLVVHTTLDARLQALRQGRQLQAVANETWGARSGWSGSPALVQSFVRETPAYEAARASGLSPEQALEKLMSEPAFMRELRELKTRVQAGFLAIDPRDGQIKAWVGSRDFVQDPLDHVQQARRQPGSTFKPFVYGAAFLEGAKPTDTLMDQAVEIKLSGGEIWRPTDETPPSGRAMTLRDGLVYSKNTITAQLMQDVGPARVARLAQAMGVRQSKLDVVPSLALGTSPVTLKEMVSAYGTLANGGNYIEPVLVTRIENRDGVVLAEFGAESAESVMPAADAYTLVDVMRGVIDRGTGQGIRSRYGIRADVAGKTGTTQDNADGWFILMHPHMVAGAWVGFNDSRVTLRSDHWGQGAHSALPMVGDFFQQSFRSRAIDARARFEPPKDKSLLGPLVGRVTNWFDGLFAPVATPASGPEPRRARRAAAVPSEPASDVDPEAAASLPEAASQPGFAVSGAEPPASSSAVSGAASGGTTPADQPAPFDPASPL